MKKLLLALLLPLPALGQQALPIAQEGKWGAIDLQGKTLIAPQYDFIDAFAMPSGLAVARKQGKVGLIAADGRVQLPFAYEKLLPLGPDRLLFWQQGHCGLMDLQGKILLPAQYEQLRPFAPGLLLLQQDGQRGLSDLQGKVLLPPQYEQLSPFAKGTTTTRFGKEGQWGLLGLQGDVLLPAQYQRIDVELAIRRAIGHKGNALSVQGWDEQGRPGARQEYLGMGAFQQAEEQRKRRALLLQAQQGQHPSLPRWLDSGKDYRLISAKGQLLLGGMAFYEATSDPTSMLAMGKREVQGKHLCALIDLKTEKLLFELPAQDLFLTDFQQAQVGRIMPDSVWNALADKQGQLLRTLATAQGEQRIEEIGNFAQGKAPVKLAGKWGYVGPDGKIAVQPLYEQAGPFSGGYAAVRQGGKYGLIDLQGKTVIAPTYQGISTPQGGLVRAKQNGKWGVLDAQGKQLLPFSYLQIGAWKDGKAAVQLPDGKWNYIDTKGKALFAQSIACEQMGDFEGGIAPLYQGKYTEERTRTGQPEVRYRQQGFVTQQGKVLLTPIYTHIEGFEKAWKAQRGIARLYKQGKVGFVDYLGQVVVPAEYNRIERFEDVWGTHKGIALAEKDGKLGFLDANGKEVVPCQYEEIGEDFPSCWQQGKGAVRVRKGGKYGLLDASGKESVPCQYEELGEQGDTRMARQQGKYGLIDAQGRVLLPFEYDGIRPLEDSEGNFFLLYRQQPARYLISQEGMLQSYQPLAVCPGDMSIPAGKYKQIGPLSHGLAYVQLDEKDVRKRLYGYVNQQGKMVIPATFSKAESFSDSLAAAAQGNKWGYIDTQGKWIIQPQYKEAKAFNGGYALVNGNQIIDRSGKQVGTFHGQGEVGPFVNGRARVQGPQGAYHILPTGAPAYAARYDQVTDYNGQVAMVERGQRWMLTRKDNRGNRSQLYFGRLQMEAYLQQLGKHHKFKSPTGEVTDLDFEQVGQGQWRMIGLDGSMPNDLTFERVGQLPIGFEATLQGLQGAADRNGKVLLQPAPAYIQAVSPTLLRVQHEGQLYYLKADGKELRRAD